MAICSYFTVQCLFPLIRTRIHKAIKYSVVCMFIEIVSPYMTDFKKKTEKYCYLQAKYVY